MSEPSNVLQFPVQEDYVITGIRRGLTRELLETALNAIPDTHCVSRSVEISRNQKLPDWLENYRRFVPAENYDLWKKAPDIWMNHYGSVMSVLPLGVESGINARLQLHVVNPRDDPLDWYQPRMQFLLEQINKGPIMASHSELKASQDPYNNSPLFGFAVYRTA